MTESELKRLYDNHQYSEIIEIYNLDGKKTEQALSLYSGFVLTETGFAEEAINCFNRVDIIKFNTLSGKIYRYIGISNYLLSEYKLAETAFCIGKENGDYESSLWQQLLFPTLYEFRETESIIFRFVDEIDSLSKKLFIMKNMKAYFRINEFIGHKYDCKKIDIYVYLKRYDSIGNKLSYSDNGMKVIHTYINDVNGHEIAHILFNSIYKDMLRNRFIDEGIATYFNEGQSFYEFINNYCKRIPVYDVIQLWENPEFDFGSGDFQNYYNIAGAFVGYLLDVYGKDKFLRFIQNEDLTHAKEILGNTLEASIQKFYNEIKVISEGKN